MKFALGKLRLPLIWWLAFVIAAAGSAASLGFSYVAELTRARSLVENNLKYWAPEFADIYAQKDWLRLSKLGKTFAAPAVRSLTFRDTAQAVFSFPTEISESGCALSEHHVIEQYGARIGSLDICQNPLAILSLAVGSPLFLIISLSLFFMISFAAVFSVLSHRRGLALLVDHLSDWSRSTASVDSLALSPGQAAPRTSLEGKLHALAQDLVKRRLESERKSLRDEIVRDIAHNINSPLATLAIRVHKLEGMSPEARADITEGLAQISGILSKLKTATAATPPTASEAAKTTASAATKTIARVEPSKPVDSARLAVRAPTRVEMLSALLDSVVADKRTEKSDRPSVRLRYENSAQGYGAFSEINALDFRVIVSNLLNNAYEAIPGSGEITLTLEVLDNRVLLTIRDTGWGIRSSIIGELFTEGFSYGKASGNGRGLFHAKKTVSLWNGNITIKSPAGLGTTVTLELPRAPAPSWFLPELDFTDVDQIITLDDDPSISALWRMLMPGRKILTFTSPEEFKNWTKTNRESFSEDGHRPFFLIDLRLGEPHPTGLDIIETEGLADYALLVTSDAAQESVRMRCSFLGTKVLWKSEIDCIPLRLGKPPVAQTAPGLVTCAQTRAISQDGLQAAF